MIISFRYVLDSIVLWEDYIELMHKLRKRRMNNEYIYYT